MPSITTDNARQYDNSRKLAARARLNSEYTIAETAWFPWVAARLPLKSGDTVLDVGCGPAWFWDASVREVPEKLNLTLTDLSLGMAQEAAARCSALPFAAVHCQPGDAAALPFADASFDAVIAMHMLYHLPDPAAAIAEMARVLKPGGFLAVTTNGAGNMDAMYALTTAFGSDPVDPAGVAFGYDAAHRLMHAQFGNVTMAQHPASLRITDPEDVFLALTSYPPGDGASDDELTTFRSAIELAFQQGNGALEVEKETGLFISKKTSNGRAEIVT